MKWIDDVRDWWKFWSVRTWMVISALIAALATDPTAFLQLLATLPDPIKPWVPFITFLVVGVLPTLVRLVDQPKLAKGKDVK